MCGQQWDHIVARRFFGLGMAVAAGLVKFPAAAIPALPPDTGKQEGRELIEDLCSAAVSYGERDTKDAENAYYAAKAKLIGFVRAASQPAPDTDVRRLASDLADAKRRNMEVATLILDNDREGAVTWAEGILAKLTEEGWEIGLASQPAPTPDAAKTIRIIVDQGEVIWVDGQAPLADGEHFAVLLRAASMQDTSSPQSPEQQR